MSSDSQDSRTEDDSSQVNYSESLKKPQILAALAAAMGTFILGNILGWSSPVMLQFDRNETDISLTADEKSWVASLNAVGGLIGCFGGGKLIDFIGRKGTLVFVTVPYTIGWALTIAAPGAAMLYAGRIISGIGGGICSVATPAYIGEVSMPSIRGALGTLYMVLLTAGILFSACIGLGLTWRWISVVCAALPLVMLCCMLLVPESPYYLVKKGYHREARQALQRLRGPRHDIESELMQKRLMIQQEDMMQSKLSDLLQRWALLPVLAAIGVMSYQQFSGINPAAFFQASIFLQAKSTLDPLVCSIITGVVQVVMTAVSSFVIERFGRRFLLVLSGVFASVFISLLGAYFYILDNDAETAATIGWLPLVSLIMFFVVYSIGVGPIPFVIIYEIIPSKIKGLGASVATFFNWFFAFIFTQFFNQMQQTMTRAGTFWFFGGMCLLSALVCRFCLPETKGKTPQEIQAFFGGAPEGCSDQSDVSTSSLNAHKL